MKTYQTHQIYNVGLFAHGGAGKTSLAEAMLYDSGTIPRLGRVDDHNTVSDYDPEEIKRGMSANTTPLPLEWSGCKLNLLDTPGYADFMGEMVSAMWVVDGAVIVLCAASGVEVGTETAWQLTVERKRPRMIFVNKMDRDNADFYRTLQQAQEMLDPAITPLQVPIGKESNFSGVIDLLRMKAYRYSDKRDGKSEEIEIPAELQERVDEYRLALIEKIAETDDSLIEKYFAEEPLSEEEMYRGLRQGVRDGTIVPLLCGSATKNLGVQPLLDTILAAFPSAADSGPVVAKNPLSGEEVELPVSDASPMTALVFKTLADPYVGKQTFFRVMSGVLNSDSRVQNANVNAEERIGPVYIVRGKEQFAVQSLGAGDIGIVTKLSHTTTGQTLCTTDRPLLLPEIEFPSPIFTAAIRPESKTDTDKMGPALNRILEEDPTLRTDREQQTGEILLSGMGESHIQIAVERMKRKFDVTVIAELPLVPYQETIRRQVESKYRHKKQTGGRGQFAEVVLRVEPMDYNENAFEFVNEIVGGVISRGYIPGVEKGVREAMQSGEVAGYPVVGVRVAVIDGKEHPVDSSEIAFKLAALQSFKQGQQLAQPVLLEPIMTMEIVIPDTYTGDIMGDLNSRRARVMGMDPQGNRTVVQAQAPLAEIQRYATDLRSMTGGRGTFRMEFDHYEEVPAHVAEQAVAQARQRKEDRQQE
ncbi:MAG: elongation factor G [Chloroflexia bacterium]|nr:elongation factor G [Chloroflexia bacterium]